MGHAISYCILYSLYLLSIRAQGDRMESASCAEEVRRASPCSIEGSKLPPTIRRPKQGRWRVLSGARCPAVDWAWRTAPVCLGHSAGSFRDARSGASTMTSASRTKAVHEGFAFVLRRAHAGRAPMPARVIRSELTLLLLQICGKLATVRRTWSNRAGDFDRQRSIVVQVPKSAEGPRSTPSREGTTETPRVPPDRTTTRAQMRPQMALSGLRWNG